LALVLLLALLTGCRQEQPLPTFGSLPSFTLTDQGGRPFSSDDLSGRVALIDFIYTSCADSCPLLSANMRQVQQALKADGLLASRVMLLSLSIDPERDRPEVLRTYAERFGAEPEGWKFLTGSADTIGEVGQGLKLGRAIPLPPSPTQPVVNLAHSNRFVLVDGSGQVRAYYPGEALVLEDVLRDVKRLVQP
jgi:protein SCO1/2